MQAYCEIEWRAMSEKDQWVIEYAYHWDKQRNFREMGAIYAVENKGKMRGVRSEFNGDECAGPGQNNVRYAAIRTFGADYTLLQYTRTLERLQSDLDYSLNDSFAHIEHGLLMFKYRWEVWKYYNGQNAPHERYPAKVQAWLKFLDGLFENTK